MAFLFGQFVSGTQDKYWESVSSFNARVNVWLTRIWKNMKKSFIGVDLSLTSPGVACLNEDGSIKWLRFFAHKPKHEGQIHELIYGETYPIYSCESERYDKIGNTILGMIADEIDQGNDVKVALEGYSFGSTGSRLFQIAENGGHFKYLCWRSGVEVQVVAPTTVKKLATGKGNCQKELVYQAFVDKYQLNLHDIFGLKTAKAVSPISDIADATFMAEWARQQG